MRRILFAGAVCTLLVCPAGPPLLADGTYTIQNLGTISGIVPHVTGINASGAVSGWYVNASGGIRAVRYTDETGWEPLHGLESVTSFAFGINDRGDIVGYVMLANNDIRAYRYTDAGGVEFIAPLDGGTYTIGNGINNTGEIAGYGSTATASGMAFRQSPGLLAQPIDTLGGSFSGACGINDNGQVAGIALTSTAIQHGFRTNLDGTVAEIPGLAGPDSANSACGIDSNGAVTGHAEAAGGAQHAFLYTGSSIMDLDTFGSSSSEGLAISSGVVVGDYTVGDTSATHAFRYSATTGSVDLNTLLQPGSGWVLSTATGVNSKGAIIGEGTLNGASAVWRLAPPADTVPPTIVSLSVNPSTIKPNNKMASVAVSVTATDNVDPQPICSITSIDATEANAGDAVITGDLTASLLATKDSRGQSRTYALTVTCGDASQNLSTGEVDVFITTGKGGATSGKPVHVTGAAWKGKK